MTSCPCCGSSVDRPVIVSLDTNVVSTPLGSVKVRAKYAEILFVLAKKFPETVRHDTLGCAVFGDDWFDRTQNELAVQIWLTRKIIEPLGIGIKNVFGTGYRLSTSKTEGA